MTNKHLNFSHGYCNNFKNQSRDITHAQPKFTIGSKCLIELLTRTKPKLEVARQANIAKNWIIVSKILHQTELIQDFSKSLNYRVHSFLKKLDLKQ